MSNESKKQNGKWVQGMIISRWVVLLWNLEIVQKLDAVSHMEKRFHCMCVGKYVIFSALQTCCTAIFPRSVLIGFISLYFFASLHFVSVIWKKKCVTNFNFAQHYFETPRQFISSKKYFWCKLKQLSKQISISSLIFFSFQVPRRVTCPKILFTLQVEGAFEAKEYISVANVLIL